MSKLVPVLAVLALFSGCRREEIKRFAEPVPGLTDAKLGQVRQALSRYEGVKDETIKLNGETLEMDYDSMTIAKENIRREVEACLK